MDLKKKLYRSRANRIIAGVCGGLGEYFEVDPILIRVIFLLLCLMHGAGIFFYVFCVIIIPREGAVREHQEKVRHFTEGLRERAKEFAGREREKGPRWARWSRKNILGVFIMLLGFILLLNKISPITFLRWEFFWPAALILLGAWLVLRTSKKQKH